MHRRNPVASMLAGAAFGRHVGVWRIAAALHDEAVGKEAPSITVEATREFAPWDDVVENWSDGRLHVWQVKSGAVLAPELVSLVTKLHDGLKEANATLVTRTAPRIPGIGELGVLDELLQSVRAGAGIETSSAWFKFLCANCGGSEGAKGVARRLNLVFAGNLEAVRDRARDHLEQVYEADVLAAVLDRLCTTVEVTTGSAMTVSSLRQTALLDFETRRRATLAVDIQAVRRRYIRTVQSAVESRRVLRNIRQDGVKLTKVWTEPRFSTASGHEFPEGELVTNLSAHGLNLLSAPAGSGKTEILARLAATLAGHAHQSPEAALPILLRTIDARGATDEAIAAAADSVAPGVGELLQQLLRRPDTAWGVLIDGVDETENGAETVDALMRRFPNAMTVATARPSIGRTLEPAAMFQIEPWTPADAELFIGSMAELNPTRAETLRKLDIGAGVLHRPLTATLAAIVALRDDVVPLNRAQLFRSAIPALVEQWAERRNARVQWAAVADDVRQFALECVRGDRAIVSETELQRFAHRAAPDRSNGLRVAVEVDFGLLVPTTSGYEFLLRGLAEYLAAELLSRSDDDTLDAAAHSWGSEAARQSLDLIADEDPARFCQLVRTILANTVGSDPPLHEALRALNVVIRALSDVGDIGRPVAAETAAICAKLVGNEQSPWRADRVAEAAAELAAHGGPCWAELAEHVVRTLRDPRDPGDWYAALGDSPPEAWIDSLFHCDPRVRSEGVRRLRPHVDEPKVAACLMAMLLDAPAHAALARPPAVEAGLALRQANRLGPVAEYLDSIRHLSEQPGQLAPTAASVALRPSEQAAIVLARALRAGAAAGYSPVEVVVDLSVSPQGVTTLDAEWPDWGTYRPTPSHRPSPATATSTPPPPSSWTRRRLVRLAQKAIARDKALAATLFQAMGDDAQDLYLEAVCEAGLLRPAEASKLLEIPGDRFPRLSERAQELLALAAIRHTDVRQELVKKWAEFASGESWRSSIYPGRALERLVADGDPEAVNVYAEWIPRSLYVSGMWGGASPDSRVFKHQPVALAARSAVDRAWQRATEGFLDDKQERNWLFPGSAASVLKHLAPCWRDGGHIVDGLIQWLTAPDPNQQTAAVTGLERATLTNAQNDVLRTAPRAALPPPASTFHVVTIPALVRLAVAQGIANDLRLELRALLEQRGPAAIPAACALSGLVSREQARELSVAAALRDVDTFDSFDSVEVGELIALAPEAWASGLVRQVERYGPSNMGAIVPVFELLPAREKREVAHRLRSFAQAPVLPWFSNGLTGETYRPSDLVERLLFDAGLS